MLWPRARFVCLSLPILLVTLIFGAGANLCFAVEVPISELTQEKIDQLGKLLNDADVRDALSAQGQRVPTDEAMAGVPTIGFTEWLDAVRDHLASAIVAVPLIPSEFEKTRNTPASELNQRPITVLAVFLLLVAIARAFEFFFEGTARRIEAHRVKHPSHHRAYGFHVLGRHFFAKFAPLVVFGVVGLGLFLAIGLPGVSTEVAIPSFFGLLAGRFLIRIATVLLTAHPNASDDGITRLIPVSEDAARFWRSRISLFVSIAILGWAANGILLEIGFLPMARDAVLYSLGLSLLMLAIEALWHRPRAADHHPHHGALDWLTVFLLCLIWVLWVGDAIFLMWACAYVILIPVGLKTLTASIHSAFLRSGHAAVDRGPVLEVIVERAARATFIAVAALWLASVMRAHSTAMFEDETASGILRGVLGGIVILLVADIVWQITKAVIEHRLEVARGVGGDEAETAKHGRLLTLLPILKNFLAVLIAVMAILTVLSGLGVAIGPLIAGAGIFGVAIGFGSQTLVKDVISGVFFMMDDAFRVGEYIQSGSYKGTVESFSIRSVRLRHHRGPVYTVPFGELGAVENLSRDWAIDKFRIAVAFNTDLIKVKRLVKGIGAALLEDPELGPQIIETVKLKGLEEFGDYGITISFSMKTKPGQQSSIRRRAQAMIREIFGQNGIEFASPTVQVAQEDRKAGVEAGLNLDADATALAAGAHAASKAIARQKISDNGTKRG
ncbi:mechanosensitive ion channel family protein [Rhizobium sp. 16-449-1b]|uniref:mechanosensitive ion channel family protein n=1 Tax=Rhizobium sp. 16-449-1b TaxID=2819989 RepID=UPI001ADACA7E|nr:mechanosensitive ion channel family protein [Rhizobium sp. 16-449-1b]MBO9198186.1 mechanosensitive ion channel family protein [Rhizobium sp. 16-449-1b]